MYQKDFEKQQPMVTVQLPGPPDAMLLAKYMEGKYQLNLSLTYFFG
jgi:hypothetical protein